MPPKKSPFDPQRKADILAGVRRDQTLRDESYRGQALKLFPHVCARCGREFSGKTLRELTVHHKDNDHLNNPPDGSNWELLCLYCHDDAHEAYERTGYYEGSPLKKDPETSLDFRPFEGLKNLLKPSNDESNPG
jgi:5-methylcytosine-specific restriction endonuclease McrA